MMMRAVHSWASLLLLWLFAAEAFRPHARLQQRALVEACVVHHPQHHHCLFAAASTGTADDASFPVELLPVVMDDGSAPHGIVPSTTTSSLDVMINLGTLTLVVLATLTYLVSLVANICHGWTVSEILVRIPVEAWQHYRAVLAQHPILTKACTSATVYAVGDILSQSSALPGGWSVVVGGLDRGRVVRSLLAGFLGHGPLSHYWYEYCDHFFDTVLVWNQAWWVFVPKVIVDQLLWGPFWNTVYIVLLGAMQRQCPADVWNDIKRSTVPLVRSGLKLWPLAHVVTYGMIPVEYRLLWVDMVEIVWVSILATEAASNSDTKESLERQATAAAVEQ